MPDKRSPFVMTVKTVTVQYDAEAKIGSRLDQPAAAACWIEAWNNHTNNPPDLETFSVFGLDSHHRLTSAETLTRGTRNQSPVDAQRLYRHLVAVDAVGFIVSHNHPSGDLDPSRDDLDLTRRLVQGGRLIGVGCLDHIITAPNGRWLSLRSAKPELF